MEASGEKNVITTVKNFTRGSGSGKVFDYMLASLVYENIRTLKRLMDGEEPLTQRRKVFLSHFAALD